MHGFRPAPLAACALTDNVATGDIRASWPYELVMKDKVTLPLSHWLCLVLFQALSQKLFVVDIINKRALSRIEKIDTAVVHVLAAISEEPGTLLQDVGVIGKGSRHIGHSQPLYRETSIELHAAN